MGGRVSIEMGLLRPERTEKIALLSPALAWLRDRRWRWLLRAPLPMLGLIQPAPRVITEPIVRNLVPGGKDGWSAAGVDEFLRSFLTPRGRVAFYEAARNIYLDEPHGEQGFWTRLAEMSPETLFVWGRHDQLVPIAFMKHVERVLPARPSPGARLRPRAAARGAGGDAPCDPGVLRRTLARRRMDHPYQRRTISTFSCDIAYLTSSTSRQPGSISSRSLVRTANAAPRVSKSS